MHIFIVVEYVKIQAHDISSKYISGYGYVNFPWEINTSETLQCASDISRAIFS